ncbi:hypothetical protein ACNFH5_10275 [Pseudomonas sp. NY15435]|uniref:hypothetical protein n=1 Tax=Pseudomonas sp. NY15435 TaxID=3400358 RepID=UPI003A861725
MESYSKTVSAFWVLISFMVLTISSNAAMAETLDEKAWNSVWDRLSKFLPANTSSEEVHALTIVVPATWASRDRDGLVELQRIAGAIPENTFNVDPSRMSLSLHQAYSRIISDVALPELPKAQEDEFLKAQNEYNKAVDEYIARVNSFRQLWKERQEELKAQGEPVDTLARNQFKSDLGGYFNSVQAKLQVATVKVQKYAPIGSHWIDALKLLRAELANASSDMTGVYSYEGGFATLKSISADCSNENEEGWDVWSFNQTTSSQTVRSSNWNGGGGWSGGFVNVNLGGGGGNGSNVVMTSGDNIKIKFCNLTYVSLRPGPWFDPSFLQAIDAGVLTMKPGAQLGGKEKIFGPDGSIPRLVKGAIVARRMVFEAKLSTTYLSEMRKNSGGSGGVRIGPWSIGGGGGSSEFKREYNTADGYYGRSTSTDVPVVIAIVTESTK